MKKIVLLLAMLVGAIGFILVGGCSDDDDGGVTGPTPGDPNDPQFLMVSEVIGEGYLEHDYMILELSLLLPSLIPGKGAENNLFTPPAIAQELDSLDYTYSYSDFWHIFTVYARIVDGDVELTDTLIYAGIDSLQFSDAEGPVEDPNLATRVDIHAHFEAEINTTDAQGQIRTDAFFNLTALPFQGLVINGTSSDSLSAYFQEADTTCEVTITTSQTATSLLLAMDPTYDCPASGSINVAAAVDFACVADTDSLDFSGNWTVNFVFNGATITVTYTSGNNVWTATIPCDPVAKTGLFGAIGRP